MKKEIIIMGDIEIGAGNYTDDFISDKALSQLILSLRTRNHPVDLILNGDTFDFLKCPYIKDNKLNYPRHITAEVSRTKLESMHKAHKPIFEALKKFVEHKENHVYFIIGNHDQDLFFKEVRRDIKKLLKNSKNVHFKMQYKQHQVYTEHGQQYDYLNKVNLNQIFLDYEGKQILNIPWTSFALISRFLTLKEEHPFLERIKPLPALFSSHRNIVKELGKRSIEYVVKSIIYYPIRHYFDPTYRFPRALLAEFYQRFKKVNWDIDKIVDKFKHRKKRNLQKYKLYVLGHIHENYLEKKEGWAIIHPDTWRDEYCLNEKTGKITSKSKQYVQVLIGSDDGVEWKIVEYPIKRKEYDFKEVSRDEKKFLLKAAKEEGFKPVYV